MTSTLNVGDRRRATLERIQEGAPAARSPRRLPAIAIPSIRRPSVARPRARTSEQLPPPPGTYYVIAAVVAVFVMLGLVMVLSASAVTQEASKDRRTPSDGLNVTPPKSVL